MRELDDVKGKTLLHLQCHIGTDTLSWAREGAIVTGIDFSDESLKFANQLKEELKLPAKFIYSNVYDLKDNLTGQFDIIYTSQGVLCWLKDLDEWARIINHFLKPDGIFYIMESHPTCYIFDEDNTKDLKVNYPYFHNKEPMKWDDDSPDYADANYIAKNPAYEWQWTLSDIINSLIKVGLKIELLNEYDKIFFKFYSVMEQDKDGWWYLPNSMNKIPLIFTLRARK